MIGVGCWTQNAWIEATTWGSRPLLTRPYGVLERNDLEIATVI